MLKKLLNFGKIGMKSTISRIRDSVPSLIEGKSPKIYSFNGNNLEYYEVPVSRDFLNGRTGAIHRAENHDKKNVIFYADDLSDSEISAVMSHELYHLVSGKSGFIEEIKAEVNSFQKNPIGFIKLQISKLIRKSIFK